MAKNEKRNLVWPVNHGHGGFGGVRFVATCERDDQRSFGPVDVGLGGCGHHVGLSHGVYFDGHGNDLCLDRLSKSKPQFGR